MYMEDMGVRYLVIEGRRWGPYRDVAAPVFSDDASVWAFSCKKDDGFYVVVNGEIFGPYGDVPWYSPAISPDGSVWIVVGKESGSYMVVKNGERMGPFERVDPPYFAGNMWGFTYYCEGKAYVRLRDRTLGPYDEVAYGSPFFSEDGRRWAVAYAESGQWYVLVDGEIFGPYENAWTVAFSPDGEHWWSRYPYEGRWYLTLNGKKFGPFREYYHVSGPFFENGPVFYAYRDGKVIRIRP